MSSNLEETLGQIQDAKQQIKVLEDRVEALYSTLPEAGKPDTYPAGRFILTVRENKRFNEGQARKVLPPEVFSSILVPKADTTMAKKKLTGDQYEACQLSMGYTRTLKEVTDEDS